MTVEEFLQANLGVFVTVGGSIAVALIGAAGLVWAKGRSPGREPVPVQDIWAENRQLTADYRTVNRAYDELRLEHRNLEDRFDALSDEIRAYKQEKDAELRVTRHAVEVLWEYVERIKAAWGGGGKVPALTSEERRVLTQVIDMPAPTGH